MKKRLLATLLAAGLLVGAVCGVLLASGASSVNDGNSFDPATYNYDALYVQDGLISWYDAFFAKEGDAVTETLTDKTGKGNHLTLSKLSGCDPIWSFGNGYLQISTGSKLTLNDIFTPPTAEGETENYTVEYIFSALDEEPMNVTPANDTFVSNGLPYAQQINGAYQIGGWTLNVVHLNRENRAKLRLLADAYQAASSDAALQASYIFTLPAGNAADLSYDQNGDGVLNFEETTTLLSERSSLYYPLTQDYDVVAQNGVGKSVLLINSQWTTDLDWKSTSKTALRMAEDEVRTWSLHLQMTGNGTATSTQASLFQNGALAFSHQKAGNANKNMVLSNNLASRIYSIRVYDRALSDEEMKTNHIADVMKFYQLDPSFYLDADDSLKKLYEGLFSTLTVGTSAKADVEKAFAEIKGQFVPTEQNEYTDLYVQDGLLFMVNPMASKVTLNVGDRIKVVSDSQSRVYNVVGDAFWCESGINISRGATIDFSNVLPLQEEYTAYLMYAHSDATSGKKSSSSLSIFTVGPADYRAIYAPPTETDALGGITKSALFATDGSTGQTNWKIDFDTTWSDNSKQPDLLAEPYGAINCYGTAVSFEGSSVKITVLKNGKEVKDTTIAAGEKTPTSIKLSSYFDKNFYAVLVYDRSLSEQEIKINHFADLMAYYKVDMTIFDTVVDEKVKLRLYEELAEVRVGETTREYLQNVVDSFAITGGTLGVIKAEDFIKFAGVQARKVDYASARGLFYMDLKKLDELERLGCLVEYGVLLADADKAQSADNVTLTYNRVTGEYVPTHDYISSMTAYRHGENVENGHTVIEDRRAYFAATIPAVQLDAGDNEALNKKYYMRSYIAIDIGGSSFVLYVDSSSSLFGDTISINEAAEYFLYAGFADAPVLSTLFGEYATAGAKAAYESFTKASSAFSTADAAAKLIERAYEGATAARKEYSVYKDSISIDMPMDKALYFGPLAASSKASSLLYAEVGLSKYNTAKQQIQAARDYAEALTDEAYTAALAAGADEATAQSIGQDASEKLLQQIAVVESYLQANTEWDTSFNTILSAYDTDMSENKLQAIMGASKRLTINDKPLAAYIIITDDEHLNAASALQKMFLKQCGTSVGLYNIDNPYIGDHYDYSNRYAFFLGITENELKDTAEQNYSLYGEGRVVYIEGSTYEAVEAGMSLLIKELAAADGRVQLTLDREDHAYIGRVYTPLVDFDHQDTYPAVTISSYDAKGIYEVFRQKMAELPSELPVIAEKSPEDFIGSMNTQYFVATDGDDANPGTKEAPFATLQKALDEIAYEYGSVIWLRGGTYTLSATPEIQLQHSGTVASPTFISAYPGESVTFTSANLVDGHSLLTIDQAISAGLINESVKNKLNTFTANNHQHVYVTQLDDSYTIDTTARAFLYVNNTPYHTARYPNMGVYDEANGIENGRIQFSNTLDGMTDDVKKVGNVTTNTSDLYATHKNEQGGWELYYDDALYASRIDQYDLANTQLKTYAAVYQEWHRAHYDLTLLTDSKTNRKYMQSATACQWGAKESAGNNMYFYNVIEELDAQNEYYIDQSNRLLYIWSESALTEAEMLYCSNATQLLKVNSASNVIVKDIHFTKTKTTAVSVSHCENVILQGCRFNDISGSGATVSAGIRCGLLACDFSNTTSYMATVGGSIDSLTPTYNFVQNCYFHDPNELIQTGLRMGGMSDVVSHNLFKNTIIDMIVDSYESVIEYNEFDGGSQITFDSGPIYCAGPGTKNSNHFRYNLFHNLNVSRYGIYLDDLSAGNYVYCNIVEYAEENSGSGKCVNIHSGTQNVVYNNIGLRAGESGFRDNANYYVKTVNGKSTGAGGLSYRWEPMAQRIFNTYNSRVELWGEEAYKSRYPMAYWYGQQGAWHYTEMQARDDWNSDHKFTGIDDLELFLREPSHNVYVNNVMYDCKSGWNICEIGAKTAYFASNVMFKTDNTYALCNDLQKSLTFETANRDIGFVDPENDNYSFKEDSPIYDLIPDFADIPFERMGRIQDLPTAE